MITKLKWLYPGMRVKRWLLLVGVGAVLLALGTSLSLGVEIFTTVQVRLVRPLASIFGPLSAMTAVFLGIFLAILGLFLMGLGIRFTIRSLVDIFLPQNVHRLADIVFERRQLARGPRLVVIGGGTGLATLLRGLKEHTSNLTAIVTMADDGGSSGRLRSELGIPPPGDIRNTLVALADTEPLMERLFQHRFDLGEGLRGHSFGNLFIAAMAEVTGDFEEAVRASSKVLAVRGRVIPSTLDEVVLVASYDDGTSVRGESSIARQGKSIREVRLDPPGAVPPPEALEAIGEADGIILGPGSLYTSIIPNLLVRGMADAIRRSKATKIFVCNVMTEPGETDGHDASDHLKALLEHGGDGLVDYVLVNRTPPSEPIAARYRREGAYPVAFDEEALRDQRVDVVAEDLIDRAEYARHDSERLARAVLDIIARSLPEGRWHAPNGKARP